jgi:hypothetical protein
MMDGVVIFGVGFWEEGIEHESSDIRYILATRRSGLS